MTTDAVSVVPTAPDATRAFRQMFYWLVIAIVAGAALARILHATNLYSPEHWPRRKPPHTPLFSANDRSRWCTVWALVEQGTYRIDDVDKYRGWKTIDKVMVKEADGEHFYSTKPPLFPTLVAGLYWCIKQVTGLDLLTQPHQVVRLILICVNWLPMLLSLGVLARILERYSQTDGSRFFVMLSAGTGTMLVPFLITLNNHTVAAQSAMFALYPAMRLLIDRSTSRWYFMLAGFFAALTVCNELPAALFGLALFLMLARYSIQRTCIWFVPAALIPLIAFFVTNYIATGGVMPFYASYGSELYEYTHNGQQSYWSNPVGIDAAHDPAWLYLLNCTFGHHGIFSLSPIYICALLGWGCLRNWEPRGLRAFGWLGLGLTVAVLAFYLTRTSNYNYGGMTSGLRWTFWLIPFWLIAMIPAADRWGTRNWFRWLVVPLLAISVFSATYPSNNPWKHPWLYEVFDQAGWIETP